jgi:hypothetical protein
MFCHAGLFFTECPMFYCDAEWRHAECLYAKCRVIAYLVSVGSTMVEPWPPHPKVNGLIPVPERGDFFFFFPKLLKQLLFQVRFQNHLFQGKKMTADSAFEQHP